MPARFYYLTRFLRRPTEPADPDKMSSTSSSSRNGSGNLPSLASVAFSSLFRPSPVHIALVALLAAIAAASSSLSSSSASSSSSAAACTPQDQPNPIASVYPGNATGLLNATLAIVPIPLAAARALVPRQWGILTHAYRELLPQLYAEDKYPLVVQAGLDHDIQLAALNLSIPDFQRAGVEFPFVDRLGDNHTSFRWAPFHIITASNTDAIQGDEEYGAVVAPGDAFDPPCDAYRRAAGPSVGEWATYFFKASSGTNVSAALSFAGAAAGDVPPLAVFRNVTNQPSFANGTACDNQIRFFDTAAFFTSSPGHSFAPVPVRGTLRTENVLPLVGYRELADAAGWQVATPFIENNYLDCASLQGYDGRADLPGY